MRVWNSRVYRLSRCRCFSRWFQDGSKLVVGGAPESTVSGEVTPISFAGRGYLLGKQMLCLTDHKRWGPGKRMSLPRRARY